MFLGAYQNVKANREQINKINMFPVPDQDTGNNLEQTLRGIYEAIYKQKFITTKKLNEAILNGALHSASGNVGIIYTGFLSGFFLAFDKEQWDMYDLVKAFQNGAKQARSSIQNPKQGTILDVIDATCNISSLSKMDGNINELLLAIIQNAKQALSDTRDKMEIYKQASIVDAGGYGFLLTLEGFKRGLKQANGFEEMPTDTNRGKRRMFIQILKNRFEVVALLKEMLFSKSKMIDRLGKWGDSLDIVEANGMMKIHIHTDEPDEVNSLIKTSGTVISMKTQDMTKEVEKNNEEEGSIGIVVDSGADISDEIAKENSIEIVEFNVTLERHGKKIGFKNASSIYRMMRETRAQKEQLIVKTSQPAPAKFFSAYRKQLHHFHSIICITFSSALSGSYNSALQAKHMLLPDERKRVFVFDSLCASGAQALFALKTQELIQRGYTTDKIIKELDILTKRNRIFGIPEDGSWLEAGGRITHFQASILACLKKVGIRPILGIKNSRLGLVGFRFVFERISQALYFEFLHKIRRIEKRKDTVQVYITYSEIKDEANELKKLIEEKGYRVRSVAENSPVVGAHVGPGVLFCSIIC